MEHESFLTADHAGCRNASHHILVKRHIRHILGKFFFPLPAIHVHVLCHNIHNHSKQITTNQKKNDPAGNSDSILHPLRMSHSFVSITPLDQIFPVGKTYPPLATVGPDIGSQHMTTIASIIGIIISGIVCLPFSIIEKPSAKYRVTIPNLPPH